MNQFRDTLPDPVRLSQEVGWNGVSRENLGDPLHFRLHFFRSLWGQSKVVRELHRDSGYHSCTRRFEFCCWMVEQPSHNCILEGNVVRSLYVTRHFTAWVWMCRSQNSSLQHFLFWYMFSFMIQSWQPRNSHEILLTFQGFLGRRRGCRGKIFFRWKVQLWHVVVLYGVCPAGGIPRINHTPRHERRLDPKTTVSRRNRKSINVAVHKFAWLLRTRSQNSSLQPSWFRYILGIRTKTFEGWYRHEILLTFYKKIFEHPTTTKYHEAHNSWCWGLQEGFSPLFQGLKRENMRQSVPNR